MGYRLRGQGQGRLIAAEEKAVEEAEDEAEWIEDPSKESPDDTYRPGDDGPDSVKDPANESDQDADQEYDPEVEADMHEASPSGMPGFRNSLLKSS